MEPLETVYRPTLPTDLALTLAPLRHGAGDPTIRISAAEAWRATRTPAGAATVRLRQHREAIAAAAWGPGREWALASLPELLGASDDASGFRPCHPIVRELHARLPGLRFPRTQAVIEALVPAVLEQKVAGLEARRTYRALLRRYGERAPGPAGLLLPPEPRLLASLPYYEFHPLGIERRRAEVIGRAARRADRLEESVRLGPSEARRRLTALPGIGVWTAAEVTRVALGDPDAVSVGDYHVPGLVCWALAGERGGDDTRMLELLAPYEGQRARVVRLLELSGSWPARRAPRARLRDITAL